MKTIELNTQQTMTSLEIAELTGKQHFHVMEAIRKMEPAWKKIAASNFRLGAYKDANGQLRPCYQLTKTECLYIATKFNDEARAKLVLRWQELEMAEVSRKMANVRCLPEPKKILALADEIIGDGLRLLNAGAEDTLTATQVAKTFNMTVYDFNCVLRDMGIQYRRYGRWNISDDLVGRDLVRQRTHVSYSLKGEKKVRTYMTWTMNGLRFLNAKLGYPNL
ncbi:Phage antirepressor protein KilAC domain-containing protein [Prevotella sp. tc2-28]|uniref:Rha family transcriptional regulator n=1 Tax=Prevotella sp. tc2-28 TaxID=1761888 RepID=UPI0008972CD5|nr:Rha family transcriptional regulator [Prevotella sp. tc2-28]SEA45052.1 Phage antirepressor protein KilAC domain-containing protein [Prevotella sp. tc2-28]